MNKPPMGVIEGFYGRPWTWDERRGMISFLKEQRAGLYIYAPKGDPFLREQWPFDWGIKDFEKLLSLRTFSRDNGISFGIGLSVFGAETFSKRELLASLKKKIEKINCLEPDMLCLQFDDMRGDLFDLSFLQIELARYSHEWSTASKLIFCPTYYSSDKVLAKISGKMPEHYWEDLGKYLPREFEIFWTGPNVCSSEYSIEYLKEIAGLLGRKPFLWDNYPVNDCHMANFLHLRSVHRPHELCDHISGMVMNPMNQAFLSRIPLSIMFAELRGEKMEYERVVESICGKEIAKLVLSDISSFQDVGLPGITSETRKEIRGRYVPFLPHPAAREIVSWLGA